MEDARITFGRRLRLARKAQGLTLEELGKVTAVGYKHIADIERGEKVPSFEVIAKFAKALKVSVHELFLPAGAPEPKPEQSLKELAREIEKHSSPAVRRYAASILSQIRDLERELVPNSGR
jgi:transcriptional regulator with XRE-family HTH domain